MPAFMRKSDVIVLLTAQIAGTMIDRHGDLPETDRRIVDKAMALAALLREAGVVSDDAIDPFSSLAPQRVTYPEDLTLDDDPEIELSQSPTAIGLADKICPEPGPANEALRSALNFEPNHVTMTAETGEFAGEGSGLGQPPVTTPDATTNPDDKSA